MKLDQLKALLIGKPLNALNPKIKDHIALVALMAWIGLGADGLSSSAYGPEEAFLALGVHTNIAIYLAFATAITLFLISFAYIQVIELFPLGGGGYKVASHLLGKGAGAVSGSALIIDYILTIAVSVASGTDALFSLLPVQYSHFKIEVDIFIIIILMVLNLRGMKESVSALIPLFLGFVITHMAVIIVGIMFHLQHLHEILPAAATEAHKMSASLGLFASIALFLRAYSLGGGTYTGLEAVSNNVGVLAEPKVRTGKITMLLMAISLSLTAGGIIILYLLWQVKPIHGQTLNAVAFQLILKEGGYNPHWLGCILFFEAALLFVAANTGFLGCPAVMANMAVDKWLPRQFRELSGRLVTQNGVLISGIAAIMILMWAKGNVSTLVVLYSINVFLTFSLSLCGLCVYWLKIRTKVLISIWLPKLLVAAVGFLLCVAILIITTVEKFAEGGWLTVLITICVIALCFFIKNHYKVVGEKLKSADILFTDSDVPIDSLSLLNIDNNNLKTAVFFVTKHYGAGLHTLLWVQRIFPSVFHNFIFVTSGEIDTENFANAEIFKRNYRQDLNKVLETYRAFCTKHHLNSAGYFSYGVNGLDELVILAEQIQQDYSDCIFFGGKLVFVDESWWSRLLHNNTVNMLQRQLHLRGMQMVILPMKI